MGRIRYQNEGHISSPPTFSSIHRSSLVIKNVEKRDAKGRVSSFAKNCRFVSLREILRRVIPETFNSERTI